MYSDSRVSLAGERALGPRVVPDRHAEAKFRALVESASALRRSEGARRSPGLRHRGSATVAALGIGAAALVTVAAGRPAVPAGAMATADSQLFTLTNQDRTSNGVPALSWYAPLGSIGENGPYGACGFSVQGRAQDMLDRNYFAHPILGCGHYAWTMMAAQGIPYRSAGENIAWNTYPDQTGSVTAANSWLMNSPVHRANILNPGFDHVGIGSANSGAATWSGGGYGPLAHVSIYAEEFARLGAISPVSAPAPLPPPAHPAAPARPAVPPRQPARRPAPAPPPLPVRRPAPARLAAPPAPRPAVPAGAAAPSRPTVALRLTHRSRSHRPAAMPGSQHPHPLHRARRHHE